MVERSTELREPRSYIAEDGHWPKGPFTPDATFPVHEVAIIVDRLTDALDDTSISAIARHTGLNRVTVSKVFNGVVWPEYITLSRIHEALGLHITQTAAKRSSL